MTKKTEQDVVAHLEQLIQGIKVAMMTTVEEDGSLRSRPMWTQSRPFDGELWFFTREHSAKVDEVEHDHHVSLSYAEPTKDRFVSVSGRCRLVTDKAKAREMWNPALKAWFPDGLDDPELSLLCITVEKAEYWDTPNSRMVQLIGFVKATLTGSTYQPSGHEKVNVTGTPGSSMH
ncbi:pyridoxamine 5'-phosphate oxidase family protein [Stigmatella aurantiaca]|uniref:General stress protein n=1 Tax=Stigmatella aurantiaca (strain DW4/3-1) TaxID=378806 RepID=Q092C0_STIAD|nr:pyridoxamine 5'-phosphate oxidase family protein [Stigmatella aurantiaca]ADO75736.1 Pyridoxamine 5'-phosphate oxidase-like FMN-binding protein [Stigmatella aurantiaca DW4/3-1]EAU66575.1 general stress protein [Stigmatella aurantiaca DW4/3-1]